MTYSHILWDFNGTLFDDVNTGIQSANVLLKRRGLPLIDSVERYRAVFCFPIVEYYKNIGLDFEKERFEGLAVEWMEQYLLHSRKSSLFEGIIDVLNTARERGITQVILSATERGMLTGQLRELGILEYFDAVLGLDNIHAHSKAEIAMQWVNENQPQRAVLFGDTVHDSDVAARMGIDCILIANGHQARNILESCGVPVIDSAGDILRLRLLD